MDVEYWWQVEHLLDLTHTDHGSVLPYFVCSMLLAHVFGWGWDNYVGGSDVWVWDLEQVTLADIGQTFQRVWELQFKGAFLPPATPTLPPGMFQLLSDSSFTQLMDCCARITLTSLTSSCYSQILS